VDEAVRQYQQDILRSRLTRRRFMAGAALGGMSAFLAACANGTASPSAAPSVASSAPSTEPSVVPSIAEASPTPIPSYTLEKEFYLFNWSDYFSPDNKKTFTTQFGLSNFVEDTYPSNEEMLAKLQAGGKGQYDVAVPTEEFVATMASGGFLQKLDLGRLPNLKTINPKFRSLPSDPNNDYIVPKDWGTTGIIYRGNKVKEPVTSWADFWTLATGKYSGKTLVVDSPEDVFVAPLRMHGFDVNTSDTAQLETARQELLKLRPHLQSIDSDNYPQTLKDEEAVLALAWNGTAYLMQTDPKYKDTGYVIPSDGTIIWVDTWVMLADAPHPNIAYAFLDWIQTPAIQVIESEFAGYASANDAAKPLLPPEFVASSAVYLPDADANLVTVMVDQSANKQRADIWAEFKQG
jgi:spermidine/putrescine transport system substrate-binding protein